MTAWLRCRLDSGMFSDEVAVTYPAVSDHWQKSVFVPRSCVRVNGEHEGAVVVRLFIREGAQFAVLPSPEGDIVKVLNADLDQR